MGLRARDRVLKFVVAAGPGVARLRGSRTLPSEVRRSGRQRSAAGRQGDAPKARATPRSGSRRPADDVPITNTPAAGSSGGDSTPTLGPPRSGFVQGLLSDLHAMLDPSGHNRGIDMRRFEFRDGSSAKFWAIEVDGTTITTRWGRIGT